jgi:hypothetical protein
MKYMAYTCGRKYKLTFENISVKQNLASCLFHEKLIFESLYIFSHVIFLPSQQCLFPYQTYC